MLVPIVGVEPNRPPPVVPAVVVAARFVALLRFPNNPPPAAPVLVPNELPLGAAALGIPVAAVLNPRILDVAGAGAPSGGLL